MKILIIRLSAIGDLVLTTAAIRCLKEQLPGCEIHFLVKPAYKEVLAANPYISSVHTFHENLEQNVVALRAEKFDEVIDFQNNFRTRKLTMALGKNVLRIKKHNVLKWFYIQTKIVKLQIPHFALRCIQTLAPMGIKDDGKGLDFYYHTPTLPPLLIPETSYICIVIGGTHFTKRLPAAKVSALIESLSLPVVLLGGENEVQASIEIEKNVSKKIYNHVGKLTLNQSVYMLHHASKVISNDTGLMHIAAALRKPLIAVWGNTLPAMGLGPYYGKEKTHHIDVEVHGLSCRPCSKLGKDACPKKHFDCMQKQDISRIAQMAEAK